MENNLTIENVKIMKLNQLNEEDRIVYQSFFTILIKMGRDTKLLVKNNPKLTLSEYPHLIMLTKRNKYLSIYYSIEQNSWIIQRKPGKKEKFNPTAISGIIEFLCEFNNDSIMQSVEITSQYINNLINLYVPKTK